MTPLRFNTWSNFPVASVANVISGPLSQRYVELAMAEPVPLTVPNNRELFFSGTVVFVVSVNSGSAASIVSDKPVEGWLMLPAMSVEIAVKLYCPFVKVEVTTDQIPLAFATVVPSRVVPLKSWIVPLDSVRPEIVGVLILVIRSLLLTPLSLLEASWRVGGAILVSRVKTRLNTDERFPNSSSAFRLMVRTPSGRTPP